MNRRKSSNSDERLSLVKSYKGISRWLYKIYHVQRNHSEVQKVTDTIMLAAALLLNIPLGGIERFSFVDWDELKDLLDGCQSGYEGYYSYTNIQGRYKATPLYTSPLLYTHTHTHTRHIYIYIYIYIYICIQFISY